MTPRVFFRAFKGKLLRRLLWLRTSIIFATLSGMSLLAAFQGNRPIVDGNILVPEVIEKVKPEYTEEARAANREGDVWVSVLIDERGLPTDLKVTRRIGFGLDEQAMRAIMMWRFRPATREGVPVARRVTIVVPFTLR